MRPGLQISKRELITVCGSRREMSRAKARIKMRERLLLAKCWRGGRWVGERVWEATDEANDGAVEEIGRKFEVEGSVMEYEGSG